MDKQEGEVLGQGREEKQGHPAGVGSDALCPCPADKRAALMRTRWGGAGAGGHAEGASSPQLRPLPPCPELALRSENRLGFLP